MPELEYDFEGKLSPSAVGEVFKQPRDVSCNRQKFCDYPSDVLYNIDELPHRQDHGIIETSVQQIKNHTFEIVVPSKKGKTEVIIVSLNIIHSPEDCMYPHTEILVLKNGDRLTDEVKPKTLKTAVREELAKFFRVCHEPNPSFQLNS